MTKGRLASTPKLEHYYGLCVTVESAGPLIFLMYTFFYLRHHGFTNQIPHRDCLPSARLSRHCCQPPRKIFRQFIDNSSAGEKGLGRSWQTLISGKIIKKICYSILGGQLESSMAMAKKPSSLIKSGLDTIFDSPIVFSNSPVRSGIFLCT